MKEIIICICKIPEPRTKCSENGIYTYCIKCKKEFKNKLR